MQFVKDFAYELGQYLRACFTETIALREKNRPMLALLATLLAAPMALTFGGHSAGAQIAIFVTAWAVISIVVVAPFSLWRKRREWENALLVTFNTTVSGCRVETRFSSGEPVAYYRLWVRPPPGQIRKNCTGNLVDVMAPYPTLGSWVSIWSPERLRLTWATSTLETQTSIDLVDDTGEFLDVFAVTASGRFLPATPGHMLPATWRPQEFTPGATYLLRVSLRCADHAPTEVRLQIVWPTDWNVDVALAA